MATPLSIIICAECERHFCPTCEEPHTCAKCGRVYCEACTWELLDNESVCDLCQEN